MLLQIVPERKEQEAQGELFSASHVVSSENQRQLLKCHGGRLFNASACMSIRKELVYVENRGGCATDH